MAVRVSAWPEAPFVTAAARSSIMVARSSISTNFLGRIIDRARQALEVGPLLVADRLEGLCGERNVGSNESRYFAQLHLQRNHCDGRAYGGEGRGGGHGDWNEAGLSDYLAILEGGSELGGKLASAPQELPVLGITVWFCEPVGWGSTWFTPRGPDAEGLGRLVP